MSAEPISIEIDGVQHGWANATLRAGDKSYRMEGFCYTTYAFDDMARFGVNVALDAFHAVVDFDGEPSGWRWEYERVFHPVPERLFRVLELSSHDDPEAKREVVFSAQLDRDDLARAVLESWKSLEADMSIEGFERAWMQSFPARGIAALGAALTTDRRPDPDHGPPVSIVVLRGNDE